MEKDLMKIIHTIQQGTGAKPREQYKKQIADDGTGIYCEKCQNTGNILKKHDDGTFHNVSCECKTERLSKRRMVKSGLGDLLDKCRLDNFDTKEKFQEGILSSAKSFISNHEKQNWFYIGGQVGCGKTHICTAICNELMKQGLSVKYIRWRDEVRRLRTNINDDYHYNSVLSSLLENDVLYIDDFFKVAQGNIPTPSDIQIAFDIINEMYIRQNKIVIISSEYNIDELVSFDGAVGSRIREKSNKYLITISRQKGRNYRMKN